MNQSQFPPLQRHPSLQPFSRDHYLGLRQSQRMGRAAGYDPARRRTAVAEFLEAWDREIDAHFADEERLLLPLMGDADTSRLLREHAQLRELVRRIREDRNRVDPDADQMRTLGRMLNDHIRWEERELFPSIQNTTDSKELEEVGHETQVIEQQRRGARKKG